MMVEWDQAMGGPHTIQYTDDASQNCTLETNVINQCNSNKFNKNIF